MSIDKAWIKTEKKIKHCENRILPSQKQTDGEQLDKLPLGKGFPGALAGRRKAGIYYSC